jgi:hypothetical protein
MIRQSRNIGIVTLQTHFVTGGSYVILGTNGTAASLNLSLIYTPSKTGTELEVELSALIDGVLKSGGTDVFSRGEIWKNGVPWKSFGGCSGYSDGSNLGYQMSGKLIDSIPANSAQITYALYGICLKNSSTASPSMVSFNWGLNPLSASVGGGTTATYLRLVERMKS